MSGAQIPPAHAAGTGAPHVAPQHMWRARAPYRLRRERISSGLSGTSQHGLGRIRERGDPTHGAHHTPARAACPLTPPETHKPSEPCPGWQCRLTEPQTRQAPRHDTPGSYTRAHRPPRCTDNQGAQAACLLPPRPPLPLLRPRSLCTLHVKGRTWWRSSLGRSLPLLQLAGAPAWAAQRTHSARTQPRLRTNRGSARRQQSGGCAWTVLEQQSRGQRGARCNTDSRELTAASSTASTPSPPHPTQG